jgi:dihydroflavonol-4-reductase
MQKRVLITGITGYIGKHVAAELLKQNYEVVGTIRSLAKAEKTRDALAAIPGAAGVTFVEADLLSDKGWDQAVEGCDYVMHIASPFLMAEPKDENEIITPAVDGTKRVIKAAMRAAVKRMVMTSSIVSMTSGKSSGTYGSDSWSDTNLEIGAYPKSKTLAERTAWETIKEGSMELVVINPGFVLGPPLGSVGGGASESLILNLIGGKIPMIPSISIAIVDVRDVARLHVAALEATGVSGKRLIAASAEPVELMYLAKVLKKAGYDKVKTRKLPNFVIKFKAIFDREARRTVPNLGVKVGFDNRETFELLNWKPTALEVTFTDMAAALSK